MTRRYIYVDVNLYCKVALQTAPEGHDERHEGNLMSTEMMTIREMCEAFDVTPRTLRFYEAKELLAPVREGQKRLFTKRDRARLKLILRGKRFGFSLEEIRQLLDMYDMEGQQQVQLEKTFELAKSQLANMKDQRAELDATIAELEEQLEWGAKTLASFKAST